MANVDVAEMMPSQPYFRDDKEFLPLQAVDLVAGTVRRRILRDPKRLTLDMPRIRVSLNSTVLDGKDMLKYAQAHTGTKLVST